MCRLQFGNVNNSPLLTLSFDKLIFDQVQAWQSEMETFYGRPPSIVYVSAFPARQQWVSFRKLIRITVTIDSIRILRAKKQ